MNYYVILNEEPRGPFSFSEMEAMRKSGGVKCDTLMREESGRFREASTFPEFKFLKPVGSGGKAWSMFVGVLLWPLALLLGLVCLLDSNRREQGKMYLFGGLFGVLLWILLFGVAQVL